MFRGEKPKVDYIMLILIAITVILTVIRIFSNNVQNKSFGISGKADSEIQMVDERYLELELEAPMSGLTGFSFLFVGDRHTFEDSSFLISVTIDNDPEKPQILYSQRIPLLEQAYDYKSGSYRVIIPFEGNIQAGDRLRIAIMGIGMTVEDNIKVKLSGQVGIAGATFEINDFVQKNILAGIFYYQERGMDIVNPLIQEVVCILFILLLGELIKRPKRVKRSARKEQIQLKKCLIRLLPVIVFLVAALDYTYYAGIRPRIQSMYPADEDYVYLGQNTFFRELCDGEAVFYQIDINENRLGGLGFYLKDTNNDNGVLTIEVSDLESQDLVASAKSAVFELVKDEEGFQIINFDSVLRKSAGKEYLIAIYYSGAEPIEILTDGSEENNLLLIPLYQKNHYLNVLFFLLSVLVFGFTLLIFFCEQKKMKVEKFLFITVVLLGILFELVITPFAVSDEAIHIDTAYRVSNKMMGIEDTNIKDLTYKRECDIYTDSRNKTELNIECYRWLYDEWFGIKGSKSFKMIFSADITPFTNSLFFLPSAIAISIGRILGIGFLPMIFLARTANLVIAAWMIYLSVKKLPFGKSIMCAIALLPITLQQIASCSYDALIIAVSEVFVSYCVFAIYSRSKLEKTDIFVIGISAIMLGICKSGVYIPLYLLLFLVLYRRGISRFLQKKGMKIAIVISILIVLFFAGIGIMNLLRQTVDSVSLRNGYYPLAYIIQHPWKIFRILENTFYGCTDIYLSQLVGEGMGSLQISVRFIVPVGYFLLIIYTVICDEKFPYIVKTKNKCMFLTAAGLTTLAVFMGFLVSYTIFGSQLIGGIQGRYFIPVLWLFLICIRKGKIVNRKKQYRKLIKAGYLLGIGTVLQLVINILMQ